MYHAALSLLVKAGIRVVRSLVGNYVTSLDMAGGSLTVTMLDTELKRLWMLRCIPPPYAGEFEALPRTFHKHSPRRTQRTRRQNNGKEKK